MCVAGSPADSGAELERSVRLEGLAHRGRNIQKGFWGGGELLEVILRQGAEKWVEIPGWQGPPPPPASLTETGQKGAHVSSPRGRKDKAPKRHVGY